MKRFLMYFMTYILITFSTAFGVVLISNPTAATNKTVSVGGNMSSTTTESPLTYIMDNITTLDGMNVDAEINLVVNETPINLFANVTVDMAKGFENVAVSGTLTVDVNQTLTDINFTYIDGTVYVSMLNGYYKITTNNLMETVSQMLTMLNVEIPDMGLDIANLDMNSMMGLLNNITETKTDTGTNLSVYIPGLGNATVGCDLNYNIKQISLPKTTLEGITFKVKAKITYPENCTVNQPTNNHIDLTHVFNLLEGLTKFISKNKLALNLEFNYNDIDFNGNLILDLDNKNVNFNTIINNNPLNLTLINSVLYVEYENIFVKADLTRIGELAVLMEKLGINLPLNKLLPVMTGVQTLDIDSENLTIENFDINNTDLGILEKFEFENGVYNIVIRDMCELTFTFNGDEFENIMFNGFGATAKIESAAVTEIKLAQAEENYVDVYDSLPTITALLNTIKLKHHYGTVNLTINNTPLSINYNVYVNDGFIAELTTNILNEEISVKFEDNNIYLSFMDLNIVCEKENLETLLNFATEYISANTPEVNVEDVKEIINGLLNQTTLLISEFERTENGLNLTILNKVKATILHNELIGGFKIETDKINLNITLNSNNEPLNLNINKENYVTVNTIYQTVTNLVNYVKNGKLYFNTNLTVDNFNLTGFVGLDVINNSYNLQAILTTEILEKTVVIKLKENTVYLEIDGLNLKFNLNDTEKAIKFIETNFGVDFAKVINETTQNLSNFELPNSFEGLNLKLTNNTFEITYNNIQATLTTKNYNLTNIDLTYNNLVANIEVTNTKPDIALLPYYENIVNLLPFAESVINTVRSNKLEGSAYLIINNYALNFNFKVAYNPKLQLWLQTNINGATVKVNYFNSQIFVSIDDLNIKAGANELDKIIEFVNSTLNVNLNTEALTETVKQIDLTEVISGLSLSNFTNFTASNHTFSINTFGINTIIQFSEYINNVDVRLANTHINITLNKFANSVYMPTITESAYESVDVLLTAVKNIKEGIENKNIEVNGNITINDFVLPVNIEVLETENLTVKFTTTLKNKELEVALINNEVYAIIDGFKVKYDLNNASELTELINSTFNLNLEEELNKLLDVDFDLEQTLRDLIVYNLSKKSVNNGYKLNVALLVNKELINTDLTFINNNLNNITLNYNNISANLNINFGTINEIIVNKDLYLTDLQAVSTLITPGNNLINGSKLELNGNLTFNLLGDDYDLTLTTVKVDYSNLENIKVVAKATFLGFEINLAYLNNTIYVGADNLKTYVQVNEIQDLINWVNETFNLNIELPKQEPLTEDKINNLLNSFTLGEVIKSVVRTPNGVMINLPNYSSENGVTHSQEIVVSYNTNFTNIIINHELIYANINFVKFNNEVETVTLNSTELASYVHYTELTDLIATVTNFVTSKQYSANAQALVYNGDSLRYDVNLGLKIDVINELKVDGYAEVKGEQNVNFDLDYWNKYLFINYQGLKLKISESDIKGLLSVVLNLLGVDPSLIPFLEDAAESLDNINFDSVSGLIPEVDMGNPLSLLTLVLDLSYENGEFKITIDGSKLSENPNAKEMFFTLKVDNNKVTNLSLTNLYTGVTKNEYFNLNIDLTNFTEIEGISTAEQSTYHDLSGTTELVKALINTAELNYYHITATVDVVGTLLGTLDIDWDIPLDVKIELDENRKPIIMATLGEIPTMGAVNKGLFESVKNRMFYVYYKDGFVYLHRTETASGDKVEYKLKLHINDVLADPLYVLQFGTGFTDTIMDAIQDSLDKSKGHTPDPSNVLKTFTAENSTNFNLVLNMEEISNDPLMGDMTVGLTVVNNESTNNKNYLGEATFGLAMPLAEGFFDLNLGSENITLTDIGKTLDLTPANTFINSYPYGEGEEYIITNGSAQLASLKQYTITFNENGGAEVSDITAVKDSPITLPNYTELRCVVNESAGTRTYYSFDGWYTDPEFRNGTKFTATTMPRGGITLYAKWNLEYVEKVVTITFNSNGGSAVASYSNTAGVWVDLSAYKPHKCDTKKTSGLGTKCTHTHYNFEGWYLDSALTQKFNGYMPSTNTTLYAKYTTSTSSHSTGFGICTKKCC